MMAPWIIASAALLVAIASWIRARRIAGRLDQLSQMYWELKYEQGELRVELQRLRGSAPVHPPASSAPAPGRGDVLIPLASLKR